MRQPVVLAYEFVKAIPEKPGERTLYVSMDYATVAHKCAAAVAVKLSRP